MVGIRVERNIMNIRELSSGIEIYRRLQKIAKTVHTLDENACNYELLKAQETRLTNLLVEAEKQAQIIGLHIYHQSDPRGCSLHLVESLENAYTDYTNGIAVY